MSMAVCRPLGWLATPKLASDTNATIFDKRQVFLTLTFSQPVLSISPSDIQVNLTEALAPASGVGHNTEVRATSLYILPFVTLHGMHMYGLHAELEVIYKKTSTI